MPGCPLALAASCGVKGWLSSRNWPRLPLSFRKDSARRFHKLYPNTHTWGFFVLPGSIPGAGEQDCFPSKHKAPPGVGITGNGPFL